MIPPPKVRPPSYRWKGLTAEQKRAIKRRCDAGEMQKLIALEFGISQATVSYISRGMKTSGQKAETGYKPVPDPVLQDGPILPPLNPVRLRKSHDKRIPDEVLQAAAADFVSEAKPSYSEIGRRFEMNPSAVQYWMERLCQEEVKRRRDERMIRKANELAAKAAKKLGPAIPKLDAPKVVVEAPKLSVVVETSCIRPLTITELMTGRPQGRRRRLYEEESNASLQTGTR